MKYQSTGKELTARMIVGNSMITKAETIKLCEWLARNYISMDFSLFDTTISFLEYALLDRCFKDFLLDNGYIEKKDTWVSPKQGDKFKDVDGNREFMLSLVDSFKFALIITKGYDTGNRWSHPVRVENLDKITKEEFSKMLGISLKLEDLEPI